MLQEVLECVTANQARSSAWIYDQASALLTTNCKVLGRLEEVEGKAEGVQVLLLGLRNCMLVFIACFGVGCVGPHESGALRITWWSVDRKLLSTCRGS